MGETHDIIYLLNFPLDMFGFKVKNPPQDFISGGEKLNSLMQILLSLCLLLQDCYVGSAIFPRMGY